MQALHLLSLEPVVETQSDLNSYGFRRNRSTAEAMSQLFVCLSQKPSAPWVLEADIEDCFDHINRDRLVSQVCMVRVILDKWQVAECRSGLPRPTDKHRSGHAARRHLLANPGEPGAERAGDGSAGAPRCR